MSVTTDRIPIARPYLDGDDVEHLRGALESGWITMGPAVAEFEQKMAELVGVTALACTSATSGMHLALLAWGIGAGDEVIVPSYTFVASAHVVAWTGATPVFCDVDPDTAQIDPAAAEALVTERTKAIMPVHMFGIPAPMDEVNGLAARHGLKVLEDAACALGATYHGSACGALGDAGSFSFHPRKIVTMGEGGTLTSADEDLLEHARAQRNHGALMSGFDRHQQKAGAYATFNHVGFNYRLTDLQARLGLAQLERFDEIVGLRRAQAARYNAAFANLEGLEPIVAPDGTEPCWQSYAVRVLADAPVSPVAFRERLTEQGIAALQSAQLVPALGYYAEPSGWESGAFPVAEHLDAVSVSIPIFPGLSEGQQERIVGAVREMWS